MTVCAWHYVYMYIYNYTCINIYFQLHSVPNQTIIITHNVPNKNKCSYVYILYAYVHIFMWGHLEWRLNTCTHVYMYMYTHFMCRTHHVQCTYIDVMHANKCYDIPPVMARIHMYGIQVRWRIPTLHMYTECSHTPIVTTHLAIQVLLCIIIIVILLGYVLVLGGLYTFCTHLQSWTGQSAAAWPTSYMCVHVVIGKCIYNNLWTAAAQPTSYTMYMYMYTSTQCMYPVHVFPLTLYLPISLPFVYTEQGVDTCCTVYNIVWADLHVISGS